MADTPPVQDPPVVPATPATPPAPVATPAPATPPAPEPDPAMFAGKFKGIPALEEGFKNLHKQLTLPPLDAAKPIFGAGGLYTDAAELEKAYLHLEKVQGALGNAAKPPEPKPAVKPEPAKPELPKLETPAPVVPIIDADDLDYEKIVESAGLKMPDLEKQWEEKGELTAEQYAALKAKGRGRKEVDRNIRNEIVARTHEVARVVGEIETLSGGRDKFEVVKQWAATGGHYTAAQIAALDAGLQNTRTTVATWKQVLFDYAAKNGQPSPALVQGRPPAATGAAYSDPAEYQKVHEKMATGTATPEEKARYGATDPHLMLRA